MAISVAKEDTRYTVEWQEHFTISLPDTPSNRKALLVFLRSHRDKEGKCVFTFQELSVLFDSNNRQASSQHMEDFWECGCDFLAYLTRKRKVDSVVLDSAPGLPVLVSLLGTKSQWSCRWIGVKLKQMVKRYPEKSSLMV